MAPYSRKLAKPFSAWRFVTAAVKVVYISRSEIEFLAEEEKQRCEPFRDRRDQLYLQTSAKTILSSMELCQGKLTDVDVRLCPLESCSHASESDPVLGEDMVHGIDTPWLL